MINAKLLKRLVLFGFMALAFSYIYHWSPYKLEFLGHYDKIWAHRVNSTEKLVSAINYFEGVELDLVYLEKEDVLDVNHPPAESIGLSFDKYMSVLNENEQPYLWLDIKNLKADNAQLILRNLLNVLKNKNYPLSKVLVETQFPEALTIFTEAGFKASYYLPYGMGNLTDSELKLAINKIDKELAKQPKIGISSNYHDYELMRKHFPDATKYLWALMPTFHTNFSTVKKPLQDSTVEVMLIKYNALTGDR